MKKLITAAFALLLSLAVFSQDYNPDRYRESIFDGSLSITNVKYGEAPQWIWPYWNIDLELDVYVPNEDDNPKRPLIIFAHAGGFLLGSKEVDNMVAICDSFAQKGFVTASIDYRKGFDPIDGESAERAVYRAVQDGKAAVRYFKENASLYDIDTNNIFFAGMSAGGYISLHVAYMDKESERPESTYGGGLVNDLECLDCAGNDFDHGSNVRAIIDFWGGVDDTTLIEEGDVPMLIMHGENDETVPFVYGHPFGLFTLPESYGGQPISERAANVGVDFEMFTSTGSLHMLDGSDNGTFPDEGPNSFWSDTLLPESERFLFQLLKPYPEQISEPEWEICFGESVTLEVSNTDESHYEWTYDEALIDVLSDENEATIELEFNNAGTYEISVVEFNCVLAASDTLMFEVVVADEISAAFTETITDINYVEFSNESAGGIVYEWSFGDGETSSDESPTHVYDVDGTYEVVLVVTNELGCTDTFTTSVDIFGLGFEDETLANLVLYPNPFIDQLTLQNEYGINQVSVMDASGRTIYLSSQEMIYNLEIYTGDWATGVYFVTIESESGQLRTEMVAKN